MAKQEYIKKNKEWLTQKAKQEGVKHLHKGIYYKVLTAGDEKEKRAKVSSVK